MLKNAKKFVFRGIETILCKWFSENIVEIAYQGILGRRVDLDGLRSYSQLLIKNRNIAELLSKLTRSNEHWQNILYDNSPELVSIAYQGILGRRVDPDGLRFYSQLLCKNRNLAELLLELRRSKEYWNKFLQMPEISNLIRNLIEQSHKTKSGKDLHTIFLFGDKKEIDSLIPLIDHFNKNYKNLFKVKAINFRNSILDLLKYYSDNFNDNFIFIFSHSFPAPILKSFGLKGITIYVEHGASPIKKYTYAPHYLEFDYSLLPGKLWVNRLNNLFPDLQERIFSIGFPKLNQFIPSESERSDYCKKYKLDKSREIILFAPSWSNGNRDCGIFNVRKLPKNLNIICIPHDGDLEYSKELIEKGYPIYTLGDESISYHFSFADILLSDISSTAIEFARLNKPVLCLKTKFINDFDEKFIDNNGEIAIPHTNKKWNFCNTIEPHQVESYIENKSTLMTNSDLVNEICDCYGDESIDKFFIEFSKICKKEFNAIIPRLP